MANACALHSPYHTVQYGSTVYIGIAMGGPALQLYIGITMGSPAL